MDRERLEWMKKQSLSRTQKTDELADKMNLKGEREFLDLGDRVIKTAFYPAGVENAPIVFAFHGGGFVFGNYAGDDNMYDTISKRLKVNILSVGYRRAPEFPFPIGINDCYDAIEYYLNNSKRDFDHSKIITFGSSAGANIAIAISILSHRKKGFKVGLQILNYPVTNMVTEDWFVKGSEQYLMDYNEFYSLAYLSEEDLMNPLASPIYSSADDFDKDLISVVIPAAKDDLGLCYEGVLFGNMLKSRGMKVYKRLAVGQYHGYFEMSFKSKKEQFGFPRVLRDGMNDGTTVVEAEKGLQLMEEALNEFKNS